MPWLPQVFRIDQKAKDSIDELVANPNISPQKEFVVGMLKYSIKNKTDLITKDQLIESQRSHIAVLKANAEAKPMATSNSSISQRIKKLVDANVLFLYEDNLNLEGKEQNCRIYELKTLSNLFNYLEELNKPSDKKKGGRPSVQKIKMVSETYVSKGFLHLRSDDNTSAQSQGAFNILLASCVSGGSKDNVIEATYRISSSDYVKITPKSADDIMHINDHRIMLALNGMLRQENQRKDDLFGYEPAKMFNGYCFFDVYALTKEIGYQPNKIENREKVIKMVERLYSTQFAVDASHSDFWRSNYMPDENFNTARYQYITEFYSAPDWNSKKHDADSLNDIMMDTEDHRYFVVKFHPLISMSMETGDHAFISHRDLKADKLDLPHLLNGWVKPVIGVSAAKEHPKGHHQYALDLLGDRCAPAIRTDNFERAFYKLAKRQDEREAEMPHSESLPLKFDEKGDPCSGTFWLYGYYYKIEVDTEKLAEIYRKTRTVTRTRKKIFPIITIWRDKEDKYVGDKSDHNLAIARQLKELEHAES